MSASKLPAADADYRVGHRSDDRHVTAVFTIPRRRAARDPTSAAEAFKRLTSATPPVVHSLPPDVVDRLGINRWRTGFTGDQWLRLLFHLAWHFPHFFSGAAPRLRWLADEQPGSLGELVSERAMHLDGPASPAAADVFPGAVFAQTEPEIDLVTLTTSAIVLIRDALDPGRGRGLVSPPGAAALRDEFDQAGNQYPPPGRGGVGMRLDAAVVRLGSSFSTPSARELLDPWPVDQFSNWHPLSRADAAVEYAVLLGSGADWFERLADRAGGLLPRWSDESCPAVLAPPHSRRTSPSERTRTGGRRARVVPRPEAGGAPDASSAQAQADTHWQLAHHIGREGLVTHGRGNIERWIGFVFFALHFLSPEELDVLYRPDRPPYPGHWAAVLRPRRMNLFTASARVMELAGWTPPARAADRAMPVEATSPGGPDQPRLTVGPTPDWIAQHFQKKQYLLLNALWGRGLTPQDELVLTLSVTGASPLGAIRRLVTRVNAKLVGLIGRIGGEYHISERSRDDRMHWALTRLR
ncbi:MAG: hypothetical protein U0871_19290 [Gemmataceae bacterium]